MSEEMTVPQQTIQRECDLSEQCIHCGARMRQEHAHYRFPQFGIRDACCEGVY